MSKTIVKQLDFEWSEGFEEPAAQDVRTPLLLRIEAELESWIGTPYQPGQRCKGPTGGVDCVNYGLGFLDAMLREKRVLTSQVPGDWSVHQPELTEAALRRLLAAYPHYRLTSGKVEPADLVVTGPKRGGAGHLMIVGVRPGTLYHANIGVGVQRTGAGYQPALQRKFRIIRLCNKASWV